MKNEIVELRSYYLKKGSGVLFHQLVQTQSIPLLEKWNMKVLYYGLSEVDIDAYILIRAYKNISNRIEVQNQFYNSDDWKKGPREQIISLIDFSTDIVMPFTSLSLIFSK